MQHRCLLLGGAGKTCASVRCMQSNYRCCLQVSAMGELIKAGKIKHWGVSNETTFGEHRATHSCTATAGPLSGYTPTSTWARLSLGHVECACARYAAMHGWVGCQWVRGRRAETTQLLAGIG